VQRGRWEEPRIFTEIQQAGAVGDAEMEHVFNLGLGMLFVVAAGDAHGVLDAVRATGHDAWSVGTITDGHGVVRVSR
jgi:phosphoribosylformylglycinamidine cyclo-ligase